MSAIPVTRLLDRSVDLLDPYAPEPGRDGDRPDPIRWTQNPDESLNGIFLEPPADWQLGDPPYDLPAEVPGPQLVRKKSLAGHIDDVDAIADTIESLDAEDLDDAAREELALQLAAAIYGTKAKVDATCKVLAAYDADDAAMEAEKQRIIARQKRRARQKERLEGFVLQIMKEKDLPKLDGFISTLTAKKNPPKLTILDQSLIPAEYLRTPPPPPPPAAVPDNTLIKNALKANIAIPGCRLDQGRRLERS
ncbi:MAG TPA: siphovirus Gp157 family protein [Bryobacteraceae bacterium]|nr:siphovirus Gp157 family protein [Bryobacteraceae bacterium]